MSLRAARFALVLLASPVTAHVGAQRAAPEVLVGTLGAQRIVLETWRDSADARARHGRWFAQRDGVDRAIDGTWRGDTLRLDETNGFVTEDDLPAPATRPVRRVAEWRLVRRGATLAGMRRTVQGSTDSVRLTLLGDSALRALARTDTTLAAADWLPWRGHEPYESLRAERPLVLGPVVRRATVAWRTRRDPRTGASVPVLVAHPDPARMARANAALDGLLRHEISAAYACAADLASRGFEGERSSAVPDPDNRFGFTVVHADARLLSLEIAGSVFCGGAHPSNVWTVTMLDLATGRVLTRDDLVRPGRRVALERLVLARLRGSRPAGEPEDIPECTLRDDGGERPGLVEYAGWVVIEGRFTIVQTGHPHVMAVCDGRYGTLPRSALRDIVPAWLLASLRR
jgi:hypothetical protein